MTTTQKAIEALAPFAKVADVFPKKILDRAIVHPQLTVGHLRRARVAHQALLREGEVDIAPPASLAEPNDDDWRTARAILLTLNPNSPDLEQAARLVAAYRAALDQTPGAQGGWMPIESAPRDGSYIMAIVAPNRGPHLEYNAGRVFVIRHEGKTPSDYDLGWAVYPGFGGASDFDFTHWRSLPAPPIPGEA